jgi:membrane associated rhomboid family serine protease
MDPQLMKIPARSRRQAMDWSLVLVSQGIETTIDAGEDGSQWGLLVSRTDYESALNSIRLYRLENRGWPWQREIFHQGVIFDWGSLAWVALLWLFFVLDSRLNLQTAGVMNAGAVSSGQWWRLFTGVWLHADVAHFAGNAGLGVVLLGLVMGRFGTGVGLLAAYLAGAGGNAFAWMLVPGRGPSLGASGMVMGGLGLLAVQSFAHWRETPRAARYILAGICGGVMLFVLLGLSPGTDVLAHLGGFLSGLLIGAGLTRFPPPARRTAANLACGLVLVLLVLVPWLLALRL